MLIKAWMVGNSQGIYNPEGVEDLTFFSLLEVEVAKQEQSRISKNKLYPSKSMRLLHFH